MDVFEVMVILLIVVIVGYAARKLGYMDDDFDKKLSCIVIDITMPLLVLSSAMCHDVPDSHLILPLIGVGVLTYIILLSFGFLVPRLITKNPDERGMIGFVNMFANVSFIGYFIVDAMFGTKGIFYAALLNVPYFFFIFTVGIMLIRGKVSFRQFDFKVLYSPVLIAAYIAAILVALDIDTPELVARPVKLVGDITIPAALLLIGSSMAKIPLKTAFRNKKVYVVSAVRLIVVPMCLYLIFMLLDVHPLINQINTVVIAMPAASLGTIFCLKYDRDPTLVTSITFVTILGCIITMPLIAMFLGIEM